MIPKGKKHLATAQWTKQEGKHTCKHWWGLFWTHCILYMSRFNSGILFTHWIDIDNKARKYFPLLITKQENIPESYGKYSVSLIAGQMCPKLLDMVHRSNIFLDPSLKFSFWILVPVNTTVHNAVCLSTVLSPCQGGWSAMGTLIIIHMDYIR